MMGEEIVGADVVEEVWADWSTIVGDDAEAAAGFGVVAGGMMEDELVRGVKGSGTRTEVEVCRVFVVVVLARLVGCETKDGVVRWEVVGVVAEVNREAAGGVVPQGLGGAGGVPDAMGVPKTWALAGAVGASAGGWVARPQRKMRVASERPPRALVAGCPASMMVITSPVSTACTS
jgi:hypothetical protein